MDFHKMPKVELHLHLDCSLSYEVVKKIKPEISPHEYQRDFIAGVKCTSLVDYLKCAISGIELMQTPDQLQWVTLDLFDQLKQDGVIYAEIRFAPLQHLEKGLDAEKVVEIVNEAMREAQASTGIRAGLILCTLRHFSHAQSMETIHLVEQFLGTSVVGFDIAADEAGYPIDAHVEAFAYAKEKGIPCTAHAGEACGPESVWETLEHFFPSRLGHGVRSIEDTSLIQHLARHKIHLEVCPTSNVQTNICDAVCNHPIDRLYDAGIKLSVNTDGRTISNISLTQEYMQLHRCFHWDAEKFKQCNLFAIDAAFTTDEIKREIRDLILKSPHYISSNHV